VFGTEELAPPSISANNKKEHESKKHHKEKANSNLKEHRGRGAQFHKTFG